METPSNQESGSKESELSGVNVYMKGKRTFENKGQTLKTHPTSHILLIEEAGEL